jgi:hypothetical protein
MRAPAAPLLAFAVLLAAPVASRAADPLWTRAVDIARASREWVPGRAEIVLQTVDDKGAAQETWQMSYRLSRSSTGDIALEVVSASHNGADTTAREQENQRKRKATPFSMGDNPFDPLVQDSVQASPRGEKAVKSGRPCAGYNFRLTKKDGAVIMGMAWIDEKTGAPVEVSYTASALPRGVFKLTTTMRYAAGPAGEGFLSGVLIEGIAGILFFKKSFRSTISVDAWWRRGS